MAFGKFFIFNNLLFFASSMLYFLFRTKDIHSKGLVVNFNFPQEEPFDIQVNVTLVRSRKKKIEIKEGFYRRYLDVNATFDYITYGSMDTYDLTFRIVRFPIAEMNLEKMTR